jgi:hypothetical protein
LVIQITQGMSKQIKNPTIPLESWPEDFKAPTDLMMNEIDYPFQIKVLHRLLDPKTMKKRIEKGVSIKQRKYKRLSIQEQFEQVEKLLQMMRGKNFYPSNEILRIEVHTRTLRPYI